MNKALFPPTPEEEGQYQSLLRDKRIRAMARACRDQMPAPQPPPATPRSIWRYLRIANVALGYAVLAVTLDTPLHVGIILVALGGIPAGILVNGWYEGDTW